MQGPEAARFALEIPAVYARGTRGPEMRLRRRAGPYHRQRSTTPTPERAPLPELLTVREAADLLAVSEKTVYRLARSGQLPHVRLGASVRVPRAALLRWVDVQVERSLRPAVHDGPRRRRRAAPAGTRPQQVRRIM